MIAAHALSGMVGRIAYSIFNLGEWILSSASSPP
jgi:hypothetical protein